MTNYAQSYVIGGVNIQFKTTPVKIRFDRFDPKNGNPVTLEEKSVTIEAECQGSKILLPPEDKTFAEDEGYLSYFDLWLQDRTRERITSWFESIGLKSVDQVPEESDNGDLVYCGTLAGVYICRGCSADLSIVEIREPITTRKQLLMFNELLCEAFKQLKKWRASLFLRTTML